MEKESSMDPINFFKCLADESRLKLILLIQHVESACVCDLMQALSLDQPKTSRSLAQLRQCGIVLDERRGKWMYYSLHPKLPEWANEVITQTATQHTPYIRDALSTLIASQQNINSCQ
jgi:ArsR family transcriptional regulator, arsenate/arsenite/antimonite-responsive transcriptional repressor